MNTALQSHLIPFDLPVEKWVAYYEARLVLVGALDHLIPEPIFSALICRQDQLRCGDRRNLRFPDNPLLKNASQTIVTSPASEAST